MSDPERLAAIEEGLACADDEEVFGALVDIGKYGHRELVDRVVPYLSSSTDFLREAAIRTLVFYFALPEYKAEAIRLLADDPDEGVRQVAAMGLGRFAAGDSALLRRLLAVALDESEDDVVRDAAFTSTFLAIRPDGFRDLPRGDWPPGFDEKADWPLLERTLRQAEIPVPAGLAQRAAKRR